MIPLIKVDPDLSAGLENAKRQILAIRHVLEQDKFLNKPLYLNFSIIDEMLTETIKELKNFFTVISCHFAILASGSLTGWTL